MEIKATPERVFDLIHDYDRRLAWDPFLREATLLGGAEEASVGVVSVCKARFRSGGLAMETVYVSYRRPDVAAVKMTRGPWFISSFAASIRQDAVGKGLTRVTYRYNFKARPRWARPVLNPLFQAIFSRETKCRLQGLKKYLEVTAPA